MVASAMPLAAKVPLEDPLIHLRCSTVLEYRRGRTIYSREQPSASVYLVIAGKVKVTRYSAAGQEVVLDIYQADDFFGEAALLGVCPLPKRLPRSKTPGSWPGRAPKSNRSHLGNRAWRSRCCKFWHGGMSI